jgi:AcrR family transcriptional regulator
MNTDLSENHRTRVGAERRERARARLLESALLVFAEKGPEAAVIYDVIARAGMARGSFYNYFRTNEELLEAVAGEISNELLRVIDPVVQLQEDPVARVASGTRLLLHVVRMYPLLGAFLSRLRWQDAGSQLQGIGFLARDLEVGITQKKFTCEPRVAIDLVVGAMVAAISSLTRQIPAKDYPEAIVKTVLQGLGVNEENAARAVKLPLSAIVLHDQSILKRTLERAGAGKTAR